MPITLGYWSRVQSRSFDEWEPPWPSRLSADDIERHRFEWERFSRSMLQFMASYDIVLSPVSARPAPLHGDFGRDEYLYTVPYSLTGQPVAVVPFGIEDGLPLGVQVAARSWREHIALAAAVALEGSGASEWNPPLPA